MRQDAIVFLKLFLQESQERLKNGRSQGFSKDHATSRVPSLKVFRESYF